mgnify:CR=1 FL=1
MIFVTSHITTLMNSLPFAKWMLAKLTAHFNRISKKKTDQSYQLFDISFQIADRAASVQHEANEADAIVRQLSHFTAED